MADDCVTKLTSQVRTTSPGFGVSSVNYFDLDYNTDLKRKNLNLMF